MKCTLLIFVYIHLFAAAYIIYTKVQKSAKIIYQNFMRKSMVFVAAAEQSILCSMDIYIEATGRSARRSYLMSKDIYVCIILYTACAGGWHASSIKKMIMQLHG